MTHFRNHFKKKKVDIRACPTRGEEMGRIKEFNWKPRPPPFEEEEEEREEERVKEILSFWAFFDKNLR